MNSCGPGWPRVPIAVSDGREVRHMAGRQELDGLQHEDEFARVLERRPQVGLSGEVVQEIVRTMQALEPGSDKSAAG